MKSLVDPIKLKPVRKKDGTLQVIVETPKVAVTNLHLIPIKESLP